MSDHKPSYQPQCAIETLGSDFYDAVMPAVFPQHSLRYRNQLAAASIGLADLDDTAWLKHFSYFEPLPDSLAQPLALRYHGHQFRHYNPDIGDGRGFLFAQLLDDDDRLLDLGTKGSGQTPYSRFGDGRLTLKGGVREVLATEMLTALGVETSKTFSLVETGEALERGDEPSPTRSAVLVRLNHSHIRYGTFQRLAALNDSTSMERLIDYVIIHYIKISLPVQLDEKVAVLMEYAVSNAASQAAGFMVAGFVHGVLNTDNINITGESFDYGPYRFAPSYDAGFTAAYFDHDGLYAFGRQIEAFHWNVYQLAKALLIVVEQSVVVPALEKYQHHVDYALSLAMHKRLGIKPYPEHHKNMMRIKSVEKALIDSKCSLDQFYFDVYGGPLSSCIFNYTPYENAVFSDVLAMLNAATPIDDAAHQRLHPYFTTVHPCTLLIDEIESIWNAIATRDDWSVFNHKLQAIRTMASAYQPAPSVL